MPLEPQTGREGDAAAVHAGGRDPDGDPLTYSVDLAACPPAPASTPRSASSSGRPDYDQAGDYTRPVRRDRPGRADRHARRSRSTSTTWTGRRPWPSPTTVVVGQPLQLHAARQRPRPGHDADLLGRRACPKGRPSTRAPARSPGRPGRPDRRLRRAVLGLRRPS